MKNLAKFLVVVAAVAPVAWSATYLYWQFRIGRAHPRILQEAGCRALPSAVASLEPSQALTVLLGTTRFIREQIADRVSSGDSLLLEAIDFEATDTVAVREEKCRRWKEWWRASGGYYHQEWRVWSSRCR